MTTDQGPSTSVEGELFNEINDLSKVQGPGSKHDHPGIGQAPAQTILGTNHDPSTPNTPPEILQPEKSYLTKAEELAEMRRKHVAQYGFKKGNPGRPIGAKHKLGESFAKAMYKDFKEHGKGVIERVRQNSPTAYLKVIAMLMPKDVNLKISPNEDLTDEQLFARIRTLHDAIGPFLDAIRTYETAPGGGEAAEAEEAVVLYTVQETDDVPQGGQ